MSHISDDYAELTRIEMHQPRLNDVAQKYISDLDEERLRLGDEFPMCASLIAEAVDRVCSTGRIPGREFYADVYKQKPMKVTQKVFVPVKQYPKFNFTGKILGPKGNSLRRLQEETQCKVAIKGRSSIRDREREEELRNSQDPRYAHLQKDLFLEISTVATPAESYARVAYALAEIRKYLIPDKNDEVSHEQLRELLEVDPDSAVTFHGVNAEVYRSVFDKKMAHSSPNRPKYLSLLKRPSYHQHDLSLEEEEEEEDDDIEYDHPIGKRQGYEFTKERRVHPLHSYKRQHAPIYSSEVKRIREAPVKSYKHHPFGMAKNYK